MDNDEYVAEIMAMDVWELLQHIINNPEELTDSYYRVFGRAIEERYEQLNQQRFC